MSLSLSLSLFMPATNHQLQLETKPTDSMYIPNTQLDSYSSTETRNNFEMIRVEAIQMQTPLYPSARRRSENDVIRNLSFKSVIHLLFNTPLYGVTIVYLI